jgi:hypothetical protein
LAWLRTLQKWKPGTLQPDYGLTPDEAQALTAYLSLTVAKAGLAHEHILVATVSLGLAACGARADRPPDPSRRLPQASARAGLTGPKPGQAPLTTTV